ncbi:unknown [Acidiphilium sp. CAG:727]|nr:unknown [Acidiphilium sp. CAG:727]
MRNYSICGGNSYLSGRDIPAFSESVFRRIKHFQSLFDYVEHLLPAGFGQFHAAADPVKQLSAELRFQLLDSLRNCRLRNI